MIPRGAQIYIALEPIDMRYSFDRLAGLARERVGYDVQGGAMFIFFGRRRETVKVLFCDATGICVFYKRLHGGRFPLPPVPAGAAHVEIAEDMLDALLDGLEVAVKLEMH
jgi:transposase